MIIFPEKKDVISITNKVKQYCLLYKIMINLLLLVFALGFVSVTPAFAQTIQVNETQPCFLNYTAGIHIWDNCGMDEDYLRGALIGFEWVTGGFFSLILVGLFVVIPYIKYHKAIYPIIVGVISIPLAILLVPNQWLLFAVIGMAIGLFTGFVKALKNHTSDFS